MNEASKSGLVSVIIPCYNAERFLASTVQSVFEQTYSHVEIIVIDDGSTDSSAALIRSFDERVRAEFGPNQGASAARNRGTTLARGEFVQYLDADDILAPHAIEQRVSALQAAKADIAYSDWEKLIEVVPGAFRLGEKIATQLEHLDADPIAALLKFWAPPAALTYRRNIVEKIGGWKEWLPIIQDARFLQDAGLLGGTFVHVPGIGAQYRVLLDVSLSRRSEKAFAEDVFRNGCDLQNIIESKNLMTAAVKAEFARLYDHTARTLFFYDRSVFRENMIRLYSFEPEFRLTWPKVASLMSSIVGVSITGFSLNALSQLRRQLR